ncbi:transporter substrate-binding domain-containing protein [Glaciecola sp. MH2013]|uniref:substrate-binding periplasmic protein n=1 Tax=Glaciecola sp. MH2013 TaxID=2785524 RepID=UPI00189EB3F7|nr:transporter substrate-binding domain-containing protein [Glaciecola sp. MH2013]MBF7074389.1 transporter substrate-binding domain-containing protein [Glaciecola sp. MH2013]
MSGFCRALLLCIICGQLGFISQAKVAESVQPGVVGQEEFVLTIHTEEFPPYNFMGPDGVSGINSKLLESACKRAGIRCEFILLPWNRAFKRTLDNPHSAIFSISRTEPREEQFQWAGPLVSAQNCLFKLAKRQDIVINTIDDVRRYRLGNSADKAYARLHRSLDFDEAENLVLYDKKYGELKPFAAGRVDLIIGSPMSIEVQLKEANLSMDDIEPVMRIDKRFLNGNYVAFNKEAPTQIVEKLQMAIDELDKTGETSKIRQEFAVKRSIKIEEQKLNQLWMDCVVN